MIKHPKRRGEWVELQFMARAAAHGLTVSKPWGDSARYDFAVEHNGRFSRVQVKSTTRFDTGRYGRVGAYICNTVSRAPYRKAESYTAKQIDFLAAYIIPEEVWYIVPAALLTRFAIALNPHRRDNKYFRFLEAWDLLRGETCDSNHPITR
ncbi:MAG TPA: group I intron-associated PD-(D/E)XK endonuclease [Terriglobales bacterium]|jgi:hypothetical protein|nr:group I intron-associated PD-(D/E)XK endonuclease [Terriglobales bacterium]